MKTARMGTNTRVCTIIENYQPSKLEWRILHCYRRRNIQSPSEIDIESFAKEAGIWVHHEPVESTHFAMIDDMYTIIVDNRLPHSQQRVELAHEFGHVLLHTGDQEVMCSDERKRQERQANYFAMYALAPTYLIAQHMVEDCSWQSQVVHLADAFNVPLPFMDARLMLLTQDVYGLSAWTGHSGDMIRECTEDYDYSYRHPLDETLEYVIYNGEILGLRKRKTVWPL
ncbi:ImmA/IrrE family metallo-endopeptidase [Alicyclobacillus ferrooxydans]|uniref:ImmA/IrrE family metallo-endopeptidase n=1 Tax=Alicyclobacillus ferrooxydans TaxID=471514 RepID=UPI0006D592E3|nr:ImmA/IrrE family metallo-endopeptidase [Alicyclobacillus ferrooxydans]